MCSGPRIGKLLMMGRCINKGESKSENGCNSLFFVCVFVYAQLFTIIIYFPDSQRKNKTDDTPIKLAPNFSLDYAVIISSVDGCGMSPKE